MAEYTVDLWCSEPFTNDDCNTGDEFSDKESALAAYNNPEGHFEHFALDGAQWVVIDGPDIHEERQFRTLLSKTSSFEDDWRRERAMEAGMLHGIDAYNEIMGY